MYYYEKKSLLWFLKKNAVDIADAPALVDDNKAYSWKECYHTVIQVIRCLEKDYDFCSNTVVSYQCANCLHDILILLALLSMGCHVVITNKKDAKMKIDCDFFYADTKTIDKNELLQQTGRLDYAASVKNTDFDTEKAYIILYTSGTEEKPKGIALTHYSFLNNARNLADNMMLDRDDRICLIPHISHCFGLIVLMSSIISGAMLYFPETKNYRELLVKIQRQRITVINTVPTVFLGLCREIGSSSDVALSVQKGVIAGGGYSSRQFHEIEEKLSMTLMSTYGLTECCATVTFCAMDEDRSSNVGRFISGVQGCIQNQNGELCETGVIGEICVKGYNLMAGFWEKGRIVSCSLDENGWYHTGDMGYLDAEDRLWITGRKKNIIIRGGENISALKLEKAALEFPGILECTVVGVADDFYGEVPYMITKQDDGVNMSEFSQHLKNVLDRHEYPAKIFTVSNIPTNNNGKYDYQKIHEMIEQSKA